MPAPSTFNPAVILDRLTTDRLRSYLEDCDDDLRNRVAHHEPLHHRPLADDAALLLELLQWMCPDTHTWVAGLSRIPAVLAARPA